VALFAQIARGGACGVLARRDLFCFVEPCLPGDPRIGCSHPGAAEREWFQPGCVSARSRRQPIRGAICGVQSEQWSG
jgi:hypothetical protein